MPWLSKSCSIIDLKSSKVMCIFLALPALTIISSISLMLYSMPSDEASSSLVMNPSPLRSRIAKAARIEGRLRPSVGGGGGE